MTQRIEKRSHHAKGGSHWRYQPAPKQAKPKPKVVAPVEKETWWMRPGLTREGFMREVEARHPGATKPVKGWSPIRSGQFD